MFIQIIIFFIADNFNWIVPFKYVKKCFHFDRERGISYGSLQVKDDRTEGPWSDTLKRIFKFSFILNLSNYYLFNQFSTVA